MRKQPFTKYATSYANQGKSKNAFGTPQFISSRSTLIGMIRRNIFVNTKSDPVIILGAGLAGSLMGCFLAQNGYKVEIYERNDDMRRVDMSAGRSINLALSTRGITAIEQVGMKEEILKISIPMTGRMIHSKDGKTNFQQYR